MIVELAIAVGAGLVTAWVIAVSYLRQWGNTASPKEDDEMLLVIAHPDDESMFFIPTCLAFKKKRLICLSTGNYEGLGDRRIDELKEAANILGFSGVHFASFQDGPKEVWEAEAISRFLLQFITERTVIITFDKYGASGHPNHIAAHFGVRKLVEAKLQDVRAYQLRTEKSIVMKYSGTIGAAFGSFLANHNGDIPFFINVDSEISHRAMAAHKSQFVWYRRLFIQFARYTQLNVLERIL